MQPIKTNMYSAHVRAKFEVGNVIEDVDIFIPPVVVMVSRVSSIDMVMVQFNRVSNLVVKDMVIVNGSN